jgi:hypothetical protein
LKISALPGLWATDTATDSMRVERALFAIRLDEAQGNRGKACLLALNRREC